MRRTALLLLLVALAGCRDATTKSGATTVTPKKTAAKVDKVPAALDIFRQGGEAPAYRDALDLLNDSLTRPDVRERFVMAPADREFLQGPGKLSKEAVDELATLVFLPADAAHVESSALFRDAARPLQIAGMSQTQQAAFAFDWLCRHVLLYEERADGLSPAAVLRTGFGGPSDRGVAYLALAHQLGFEGCLLVRPGDKEAPLVGVLVDKQLVLFDTRLGVPVPGPDGKEIATFADIGKNPQLLAASKISPEEAKTLEARIAAPITSLAPRMKYLDSLLQGELEHVGGDRLWAYHDAAGIARELNAAGITNVGLWAPALRPSRELKDEELIPWPPVLQKYYELRLLGEGGLPEVPLKALLEITGTLFDKYYRQPGEMLVRNKTEQLPRRLDRIRTALDESDQGAAGDAELVAVAANWRERVKEAFLGFLRKDPEGVAQFKSLWLEDQYLVAYLLQPEVEGTPRGLAKRDLSKIVLAATREPLAARSNWLFAQMCTDKAERLGEIRIIQKEKGKEPKAAAANLDSAWKNARSAWAKYLDRNNLGPSHFVASLPELQRHADRGDLLRLLTLWEYLQRELHLYTAAKLELARAMSQTGQNPAPLLDQLSKELSDLLADKSLAKARTSLAATLGQNPEGARRWDRLMRDWGPDGNLAWILESVKMAQPSK